MNEQDIKALIEGAELETQAVQAKLDEAIELMQSIVNEIDNFGESYADQIDNYVAIKKFVEENDRNNVHMVTKVEPVTIYIELPTNCPRCGSNAIYVVYTTHDGCSIVYCERCDYHFELSKHNKET